MWHEHLPSEKSRSAPGHRRVKRGRDQETVPRREASVVSMCLTRHMQLSPRTPDLGHLTAPPSGASVTCRRGRACTARWELGCFRWAASGSGGDVCYVMMHVLTLYSCSRHSAPTVCRGLLCAGTYCVQGPTVCMGYCGCCRNEVDKPWSLPSRSTLQAGNR